MRGAAIIGILLILGGLAALSYPYITYTEKERVVDVGPIKIDKEETKHIPISQVAAVAALVVGLALVFSGSTRSTA